MNYDGKVFQEIWLLKVTYLSDRGVYLHMEEVRIKVIWNSTPASTILYLGTLGCCHPNPKAIGPVFTFDNLTLNTKPRTAITNLEMYKACKILSTITVQIFGILGCEECIC